MTTISDQIKNKIELVDHIQQFIELKKQGRNWIAICPFHDDHKPSLSVSPEKGLFKCFSCGAGGDVLKFEMLWNKCSWKTAIENLNQRYQLQLELKWQKLHPENADTKKMKQLLIDAHKWFQLHLQSHNNDKLKQFLTKRQINQALIKRWKLGWADTNWKIMDFLKSKEYEDGLILKSELVIATEKKCFNFFQNRLIFPIYNSDQTLVGFVGRKISDENEKQPKYLSFPTTELFQKNQLLFNFNYPDIDINRRDSTVYLVEGILDAIRLQSKNVNVIALMGTNLSKEQVNQINSTFKKVVIWLDGDRAGLVATIKIAKMLLLKNIEVAINKSEKNADPDNWVLENPNQPIPTGKPPLVWLFEQRIDWTIGMKQKMMTYLKVFWKNSDFVIQEQLKSQIAKIYGLNWLEMMMIDQDQILNDEQTLITKKSNTLILEELWIWILFFNYKNIYDIFCANKWEFQSQILQNNVNLIEKWYNNIEGFVSRNLQSFLEKQNFSVEFKTYLTEFWNDSEIQKKSESAEFINGCFNKFNQNQNQKKIKKLINKVNLLNSEIKQAKNIWKNSNDLIDYVDKNWKNSFRKT